MSRVERQVKTLKEILISFVKTHIFVDLWDVFHKSSILSLYLNERPTFIHNFRVFSPHSLDSALLRRSSTPLKIFSLADFVLPKDNEHKKTLLELTSDTKSMLNYIANETAKTLLNQRILTKKFKIGDLIYVLDRITAKNPNSIIDCLGRIIGTRDHRNFCVELLNKQKITRHISALVPTWANYYNSHFQPLDLYHLPMAEDLFLPSQFESRFDPSGNQFKQRKYTGDIQNSFNVRMPVPDILPGENLDNAPDLSRFEPDPGSGIHDAAVPSYPDSLPVHPVSPVPVPEEAPDIPPDDELLRDVQQMVDKQTTIRVKDPISDVTVRRIKFNKAKKDKKKNKKTRGEKTRVPETLNVESVPLDNAAPASVVAETDKEWVPPVRVKTPVLSDRRLRSRGRELSIVNNPPMSSQMSLNERDVMEDNCGNIQSVTNDLEQLQVRRRLRTEKWFINPSLRPSIPRLTYNPDTQDPLASTSRHPENN